MEMELKLNTAKAEAKAARGEAQNFEAQLLELKEEMRQGENAKKNALQELEATMADAQTQVKRLEEMRQEAGTKTSMVTVPEEVLQARQQVEDSRVQMLHL